MEQADDQIHQMLVTAVSFTKISLLTILRVGKKVCLFVLKVFNATVKNISAISLRLVYWWRIPEDPEKTTDQPQVTDKLYHILFAMIEIRTHNIVAF